MRNFCTYCGARNNTDATACLACGSPLDQPSAAPPTKESRTSEPARYTYVPDARDERPIQAPGAWYSTQQHTPENPHEPSPGAVNAWVSGQHTAAPQWPMPPAGDAQFNGQSPYAYGPRAPFPPPYAPGSGHLPYPNPYGQVPGQPPYQGPYGQAPYQGQAPNQSQYQGQYAPAPYQNPPAPGVGMAPYQNGYPAQLPPPLIRQYPTAGGPYAPYGPAPTDPYAPQGGYGLQPGQNPPYDGYRPTPGYSNFSSASQLRDDYTAAMGFGIYPPAPPQVYTPPYSPAPYTQNSGGLADGGQRFGARLLDSMVLAVPMFFFLALIGATQSAALAGLWLISLVLCPAVYFISAWAGNGRTIGYRAMGIRLVRTDGGQPTLGAAIARYVTLFACMFFFFPGILGAMWMLWDERRQGWHDKVADTLVVRS